MLLNEMQRNTEQENGKKQQGQETSKTEDKTHMLVDTHNIHLTETPHEHHDERTTRLHDHDTSNSPTRVGPLT